MSSIHYNTFKTLWWYYLFFKIYQDTQINSWNISNIIMGFKKGLWRIQFKSYLPIIEEIEFTFFFDSDPYLVFWLKEFCNYILHILNWVIAMQNGFFFGYNFGQGEVCCLYKSEVCVAGGIISFFNILKPRSPNRQTFIK